MNWIAGICNVDEQPVDQAVLQQLTSSIREYAADGCSFRADTSVAMACFSYNTNPEPVSEATLVSIHDRKYWICFDGRVDNQRELVYETRFHSRDGQAPTDSDLLAAAYEMWGIDCLCKIVGDFAFSLWDVARRRLLCARDALGIRSLFYHFDGKTLTWASRIRQLLGQKQMSLTLDREYVANFLVRSELPLALTPYKEIRRLQPAHMLLVENGTVAEKRYWQPDSSKQINYSSDAEYEEHFREILKQAVRARMRTNGPVWCQLSGGFDSSSITCLAHDLVRDGHSSSVKLGTISWVYDQAYLSDERKWMNSVIDKCGAQANFVSCDDHYPLQYFDESSSHWDEPSYQSIFYSLLKRIKELVRSAGVRVILSGVAGDNTVVPGFTPVYIADLFRKLRLVQAWKEIVSWQKEIKLPLATVFMNSCVRPLLKRDLVCFNAEKEVTRDPVPFWIDPSFAKTMHLRERALCRLVSPPYESPAYQSRCERILEASETLWRGYIENACEHRYPYLDRRLVEFVLAIPWTQLFPPGGHKSLLRRAMKGILPDYIQRRTTGRGPDHAFYLALTKEWPLLEPRLRNPKMAALGFVDVRAFRHALKLARAGRAPSMGLLVTGLSLENWLRHTEIQ